MKAYQERVVQEKNELEVKRIKLSEFLETATFKALDPDEQLRLHSQASAMRMYSDILSERIINFK